MGDHTLDPVEELVEAQPDVEPRRRFGAGLVVPGFGVTHGVGDVGCAERVRIDRSAAPFEHAQMVLVAGVGERLEKLAVSPRPAAVVRRAGSFPADADRVHRVDDSLGDRFDDDVVGPAANASWSG